MAERARLPNPRTGLTRKLIVCQLDIYITVNFYPDKREDKFIPGEIFITIGKEGSTLAGLFDAWATTVSIAFQFGVPWSVLREKYLHHKFEPNDSENPSILHAIAKTIDNVIDFWNETNEHIDNQSNQETTS